MFRIILLSAVLSVVNLPARATQNAAVQNQMVAMQSMLLMVTMVCGSLYGLSSTGAIVADKLVHLYQWLKPITVSNIKDELRAKTLTHGEILARRDNLIFNPSTQRQIEAVFQKILENAAFGLSQESVLITGPAGTGKTSLATSLVNDGFDVLIISSDEICLRDRLYKLQTLARLLTETPGSKVAIVIEEAEVFFQCLSPAYTNLGSQARRELEAKFLTEFGTHGKAAFVWTSNTVKELLSSMPAEGQLHHKSSGLLRRFRNIIQTSLPDESTRRRVVLSTILKRIQDTSSKLKLSEELAQKLNDGFESRWEVATAGMSQDDLRVIAENIVAREHLRNSSNINTEDFLLSFEDEKTSLETIRAASENEKKSELLRLEEEAKIVGLRKKIENSEPAEKPVKIDF